mmetsp:Transcript_4228/g.9208  ORF Transcript_4228/g.9208 Transcript_4228/m.9208 type:complete len:257 (-) Transcript_4228:188-958(-)|eukprot:CAMPEP_0202918714 /NCGR_PEP_ID=MMETSP1392-20130828/74128_1 /ASSEMBLY_ACC=CAM_ASM_000868 /TAXON_ID=225041 /ORGANISM="Chlamydomonas chlamydogama, Strain SAG 11-48b" /LENGTH=256 /DNA_ID=CAMNT_0049611857 /DNA_START=188 /DNA_END=958 /DNA_ORIENTATION=-
MSSRRCSARCSAACLRSLSLSSRARSSAFLWISARREAVLLAWNCWSSSLNFCKVPSSAPNMRLLRLRMFASSGTDSAAGRLLPTAASCSSSRTCSGASTDSLPSTTTADMILLRVAGSGAASSRPTTLEAGPALIRSLRSPSRCTGLSKPSWKPIPIRPPPASREKTDPRCPLPSPSGGPGSLLRPKRSSCSECEVGPSRSRNLGPSGAASPLVGPDSGGPLNGTPGKRSPRSPLPPCPLAGPGPSPSPLGDGLP